MYKRQGLYDFDPLTRYHNGSWIKTVTLDYFRSIRGTVGGACEKAVSDDFDKIKSGDNTNLILTTHTGYPTALDISNLMTQIFRAAPPPGKLHPNAEQYYLTIQNDVLSIQPNANIQRVWTALCQALWLDPRAYLR